MHILRTLTISLLILFSNSISANLCLPCSGDIGIGYEGARNLAGGNWEGTTGALLSVNSGCILPYFSDSKQIIGLQLGGSYGVYSWNNRLLGNPSDQNLLYHQGFITVGHFKKATCIKEMNCSIVFDAMWNKNYGLLAHNPFLMQIRQQHGYVYNECHEFGIWVTTRINNTEQKNPYVIYRSISQMNAYWKQTFCNQAETMLWIGLPYEKHIVYSNKLTARFILGCSFKAPLTSRIDIEGHANYMLGHQVQGFREYATNVCIQLKWSFGEKTNLSTPYLPVANNSNFMMDSSIAY